MKESALQQKIISFCADCGLIARKVRWEGRRGCPDLVIFGPGGANLWVELKRPDGKGRVSPYQKREIARMREMAVPVHVVHRYDDFLEFAQIYFPDNCE